MFVTFVMAFIKARSLCNNLLKSVNTNLTGLRLLRYPAENYRSIMTAKPKSIT